MDKAGGIDDSLFEILDGHNKLGLSFKIPWINKAGFYMKRIYVGELVMKKLLLLTVLSFLVCALVFADGDSRFPTQAEKDFSKSILNTFAKVLPPGPEGWEKTSDSTEITELKHVYTGEKDPLPLEYHIVWQDTKGKNEADLQFQQELIKLASKPGFKGDGVDELQQKMTPHDVTVRIDLYANLSSKGIYEKVTAAPAIAGGLVYRSQGQYSTNGWTESATYIFLGKTWKMSNSAGTYVDFKPDKKFTTSTVVQNILVKVQADPKRADRIIQKIDWETLKKLITN